MPQSSGYVHGYLYTSLKTVLFKTKVHQIHYSFLNPLGSVK
jgi:hypothetical protein